MDTKYPAAWQLPWKPRERTPFDIEDSKGEYVATCATPTIANIMAAAPELLAALQRIKSHYGAYLDCAPMGLGDDDGDALVAMDTAIKKAGA